MSSITPKPGMKVEISMQGIEKSRLDAIESAEALRKADEAERAAAELMRKEEETGRRTAEQDRALEEYARENAEDARVAAETARANAEVLRQSTFVTNEANRQSAFDAAETKRASEWSEIKSDVESSVGSSVAAASAATDAANAATENANTAAEKSVRYDVVQALTDAHKERARGNIDAASAQDVDGIKNELAALQTAKMERYSIKTVMDSVAEPHTQYFLGVQNSVEIVLPETADVGQIISVSWYNGDTAATMSVTGTMLDFDYVPSANSRSEINALWDGIYWAVLGHQMAVV